MPRKSRKTASQKPSLLFLEPSVGGGRLKNVPEVRAALNPRSFITEQTHNNTALTSWVSPQFDQSHLAAPPPRRGRRKCQSTTSVVLDRSVQFARKSRIPSLSFEQSGTRDQSHPPQNTGREKATESSFVPGPGCQQQQVTGTSSHQNARETDTPGVQSSSLRTRTVQGSELREQSGTRDQPHPPKNTGGKKAIIESSSVPGPGCQQQQVKGTSSHQVVQETDTPRGQSSLLRTRKVRGSGLRAGAAASSSRFSERLDARSPRVVGRPRVSAAPSDLTPPPREPHTPNVSSVFTPPDVDTPDVLPEGCGSCGPSSPFIRLLAPRLSQPSTPPLHRPADVLAPDTPERDYGVKVTWRRRRRLMTLLKEKGLLSDSAELNSI